MTGRRPKAYVISKISWDSLGTTNFKKCTRLGHIRGKNKKKKFQRNKQSHREFKNPTIFFSTLPQGDRVTGYNTTLKKYFFWKNYVTSFLLIKKDLRPKHQNSSTDFFLNDSKNLLFSKFARELFT